MTDPLPTPMGGLEDRLSALEKIQKDQTTIVVDIDKRVKQLEEFAKQAQAIGEKLQKSKMGGLLGGLFS